MIPSVIKDEAFIAEVESYLQDKENFHLWWLGQSGYLLLWKGKKVLIDPYLSNSLTKKYAATNKPHVRMSERVVDPELLKGILIVTSSHNHTDHLDGETLMPLLKNNPSIHFIIPEANRNFVCERVKCAIDFPVGLNDGKTITIDEFIFYGIPAKHNGIERDEKGNCRFMGYIIQFGKWSIYHSGDTLWFEGMEDLLTPYNIDVAILPINGDDPKRGVAGNLNAKEAVDLAKAIGAKVVIPCHYDMFTFNTADVKEFVKQAERVHQHFAVLQNGGRCSSEAIPASQCI